MSNMPSRSYTSEEVAVLEQLGLIETDIYGPGGIALLETGDYWPRYARKKARDWAIAADALEREMNEHDTVNTTPVETEEP